MPSSQSLYVDVGRCGISEESKRPDLLVLKPSAVLSLLGPLDTVDTAEGSRADLGVVVRVQIVEPQNFHPHPG